MYVDLTKTDSLRINLDLLGLHVAALTNLYVFMNFAPKIPTDLRYLVIFAFDP